MQRTATSPHPPSTAPPDAARAPSRRRSRLMLEIAIALCVKAALLVALHQLWFSHPQSKRLTERGVAAALFGPASVAIGPANDKERRDASRP